MAPAKVDPLVQILPGGELKGMTAESRIAQYGELAKELGDEPLARDFVEGKAFREPALGIYMRGSAKVKEQMGAAVAFQGTFAQLEEVAKEIAAGGDTSILHSAANRIDRMTTGAGSPGFEAYEQLKTLVVAEYLKATSGAQVNETERAFLLSTFPNYSELARDGMVSDTAQIKLDTWFERGRRAYLSNVPESQKAKASSAWEEKFGKRASGADGSAPPAGVVPQSGFTVEMVEE